MLHVEAQEQEQEPVAAAAAAAATTLLLCGRGRESALHDGKILIEPAEREPRHLTGSALRLEKSRDGRCARARRGKHVCFYVFRLRHPRIIANFA